MQLLRKANVYSTIAYFYLDRAIGQHPWFRRSYAYNADAERQFMDFLGEVPAQRVFVHVALSKVKRFSPTPDPYQYLADRLKTRFDLVSSQGFTPQNRLKSSFNPQDDVPPYGSFASRFFGDMDWRNMDPCYSVMAMGDVTWPRRSFTFSEDGIFRQMLKDNMYCLNIGLPYPSCSLMHLVEYEQKVPYLDFTERRYTLPSGPATEAIQYRLHENRREYAVKGFVWWNKLRLARDLNKTEIVKEKRVGGVSLRYFSLREIHAFVTGKVKQDPFYLITW